MSRLSPRRRFFNVAETFALSSRQKAHVEIVGSAQLKVVIIDNFYKEPERVRELLLNTPSPNWRMAGKTRNFKDYYDCRHRFELRMGFEHVPAFLSEIVKRVFNKRVTFPNEVVSNNFQLIKNQPKFHTAYPHNDITHDGRNSQPVNALAYLNTNRESRGGTAFYRHLESGCETIPTDARGHANFGRKYLSKKGMIETGENFWCDYRKHWERFHLIEMKFNRLVIFPSEVFHGAWHEPNWFKKYPRLAQVFFSSAQRKR